MIRICNKITMKPKEMKSKTWRKKCARELFQLDFHCGKMRFAMLDAATMNYLKWLDRIFLFFLILVFAFVIHCQQIYIFFFFTTTKLRIEQYFSMNYLIPILALWFKTKANSISESRETYKSRVTNELRSIFSWAWKKVRLCQVLTIMYWLLLL